MNAPAPKLVPLPPGRTPPHNLEAEKGVIGCCFLNPDALDEALEIMQPSDCYREKHRHILEAIVALDGRNERFDRITVGDELERRGALEAVGGRIFLEEAEAWTPAGANVQSYARIVRDKATLRRLAEASHATASEVYEGVGEAGEILDRAEERMLAVREGSRKFKPSTDAPTLMRKTVKYVEASSERGETITGMATGIPALDRMTSGLQSSDLIILAARSGQGKTTAALNWADHVAVEKKRGVLVLSMEMSELQIGLRLVAARGRIDLQRLMRGSLSNDEWARQAQAMSELNECRWLHVDDSSGLSALDVRAKARRFKRRWADTPTPLGLVVIDYLGLMRESEKAETKAIAVGQNTEALKNLAKELEVPVLCLAQLNRDGTKGGKPRRPMLSDLRDSGKIENDACAVIFLHHEQEKDNEKPTEVEILVEKQRMGPTGTVRALHRWEFCKIESESTAHSRQQGRNWTDEAPDNTGEKE